MQHLVSFTIVIPTRDDPAACEQLLTHLMSELSQMRCDLRVLFLANDTAPEKTDQLEAIVASDRFAALQPRLIRARRGWDTSEENIRYTLGENLDQMSGDIFLIIGNTDELKPDALSRAIEYHCEHQLDLLSIGGLLREVQNGSSVVELPLLPKRLSGNDRLSAGNSHGQHTFSDAMRDYGPASGLCFIGCQIYTKRFFSEFCKVLDELPEWQYSLPMATLELTLRQHWNVGWFPEQVVVRIEFVDTTGKYYAQPWDNPDSYRHRTSRGLSRHLFFAIISNTLHVSASAFEIFVNCHQVMVRGRTPQYNFTNLLFMFVEQLVVNLHFSSRNESYRYSPSELRETVEFGKRLEAVGIGLTTSERDAVSRWIQLCGSADIYEQPANVKALLSVSGNLLKLLETRPGMERWSAQRLCL